MMVLPIVASAEEVEIDGINYRLFEGNNAEVISKSDGYKGDIVIPSTFIFESTEYNVIQIRTKAFYNNQELTSITFPNSITFIGTNAFQDCSNLSAVYISDLTAWCNIKFEGSVYGWTNPLSYAHHLYLKGEEIKELIIPEGVAIINPWAFVGCSDFVSVTIPSSVTEIWDLSFYGCDNMKRINIRNLSAWCNIIFHQGNHFNQNSNPLGIAGHLYLNDEEITDFVLPDDVNAIKDFVLFGCVGLKSVKIHSGVTTIGYKSFSSCTHLETIELPTSLTKIADDAFYNCKLLKSLDIPDGVTSIGAHSFSGCSSLTSLSVPNSVTVIGEGAFSGCDGISSVTMSDNLLSINSYLFADCYNIKSIEFPDCVKSIGSGAFWGCSGLTSFKVPKNVTTIGEYAFRDCSNLESVDMSEVEDIDRIWNYAFYNCSKLNSLSFPKSLTEIGNFSFAKCTSLTYIVFPTNLEGIGEWAFNGCSSITTIDIPNSVIAVGQAALANCTSLKKISIPNSIEYIPKGLFSGCSSIKEVYCYNEIVPSAAENAFINSNVGNATLYVPIVALENYKNRNPWNLFGNIQGIDPSGITQISKNGVIILSRGDVIDVQGLDDGTIINIYNINGILVSSAFSKKGHAIISTNLNPGSVAIVKFGDKSLKVVVK